MKNMDAITSSIFLLFIKQYAKTIYESFEIENYIKLRISSDYGERKKMDYCI